MMEVEDRVLEEYDIHVNTVLMSHLHLIQLPSASFASRLAHLRDSHGAETVLSSRFKPKNGLLEVDIPMDTSHRTFDRERGERFAKEALPPDVKEEEGMSMLDHQRLTGTCLPCNNGIIMLGTLFQGNHLSNLFKPAGSMYFTPVSSIIPLSIDFGYLDAARARAKTAKQETRGHSEEEESKPVQIQFKKRETEEQMAARLNSYAYLQRQVDDEPWVKLKLYPSK